MFKSRLCTVCLLFLGKRKAGIYKDPQMISVYFGFLLFNAFPYIQCI